MPEKKKKASGLTFNHAMVYSRDVPASVRFYAGVLGFKVLEEYQGHDTVVYARLKSPRSNGTIALHLVAPGQELHTGGVRLYFRNEGSRPSLQTPGSSRREILPTAQGHAVGMEARVSG